MGLGHWIIRRFLSWKTGSGRRRWRSPCWTWKTGLDCVRGRTILCRSACRFARGVPRPNILLPNSPCFTGGLLTSTDAGASFGLDTALSGAVAGHLAVGVDEMQILLGMPACREETAAAWIDFGASSFLCVDAVSLEGPGDLEVLEPGLRFSSAKMFQDYFTARTVLDIPLPERLGMVTADFPSVIGLGQKCYLREDVAAAVDDGRLIGVELGRVSFRAELINGRS